MTLVSVTGGSGRPKGGASRPQDRWGETGHDVSRWCGWTIRGHFLRVPQPGWPAWAKGTRTPWPVAVKVAGTDTLASQRRRGFAGTPGVAPVGQCPRFSRRGRQTLFSGPGGVRGAPLSQPGARPARTLCPQPPLLQDVHLLPEGAHGGQLLLALPRGLDHVLLQAQPARLGPRHVRALLVQQLAQLLDLKLQGPQLLPLREKGAKKPRALVVGKGLLPGVGWGLRGAWAPCERRPEGQAPRPARCGRSGPRGVCGLSAPTADWPDRATASWGQGQRLRDLPYPKRLCKLS